MPRFHPRRRWRDQLPGRRPESYFHWRGKEVSRLENLADAVFGFSITLLVVSTDVPQTFDGLVVVLRSFPAFVACFALLMIFWNVHYRFFRRYGLEDMTTRFINYGILLLVIFSVYPLKFLFNSWLGGGAGMQSLEDLFLTYRIYGAGLAGIWALYGLLFWNALRQRASLRLTEVEIQYTRMDLGSVGVNIGTCLGSILLSYLPVHPWIPGMFYATLGISMAVNGMYHGRRISRLVEVRRPEQVSALA